MSSPQLDRTQYPAFFRVQTPPEAVTLPDGDVMVFFSEVLQNDTQESTDGYGMLIKNDRGSAAYYRSFKPTFPTTSRFLMYQTNRDGYIRWVPYINCDNPDTSAIRPLKNIYSPKITYNPKNGKLTLLFWTNMYCLRDVDDKPIEPTEWSEGVVVSPDELNLTAYYRRVLCSSTGFLFQGNVDGGEVEAKYPTTSTEQNDDFIPIFLKPKVLYTFRQFDESDNEAALSIEGQFPVTDGVTRQGVIRASYSGAASEKYSVVQVNTNSLGGSALCTPVQYTGTTQYGVTLQDAVDGDEIWIQVSGICPVRVDRCGFRYTPTYGEFRAMHNFLGPIHTLYYDGYLELDDGTKLVIAELTKQRGDNWMVGMATDDGWESGGRSAAVIYFDFDTTEYTLSVQGARGSLLVEDA